MSMNQVQKMADFDNIAQTITADDTGKLPGVGFAAADASGSFYLFLSFEGFCLTVVQKSRIGSICEGLWQSPRRPGDHRYDNVDSVINKTCDHDRGTSVC